MFSETFFEGTFVFGLSSSTQYMYSMDGKGVSVIINAFTDLSLALGGEYRRRRFLDNIAYAVEFCCLPAKPELVELVTVALKSHGYNRVSAASARKARRFGE